MLANRCPIRPDKEWWEDGTHVQALAAIAARRGSDCGEWISAPGKVALLYDLGRVRELIHASESFHPTAPAPRWHDARWTQDPSLDPVRIGGRHTRSND